MMNGWYGDGSTYGGHSAVGGIFMLVIWVAVIVAVVALVIWLVRQTQVGSSQTHAVAPGGATGETALDILKARYAKGEIEKAEYEEKKKDLGG